MKELIVALGGAKTLAKALDIPVSRTANWTTRGIPWRYRVDVADLAKRKGVKIPREFFDRAAA